MSSPARPRRRLWALGEPLHALLYFADECLAAGESGRAARVLERLLRRPRRAARAPSGPEVVTATFYNFAPAFVARRVPAVWDADDAGGRARGPARPASTPPCGGCCGEQWIGSAGGGRGGGAGRGGGGRGRRCPAARWPRPTPRVPVPDEPHLALWQSLTTLREHRGDGHIAALLQREIDGVRRARAGRRGRPEHAGEWLQKARGWDDDAWDAAAEELTERGWLADGELTAEGLAMVAAVEADTDRLALGPWQALGDAGCDRLAALLTPCAARSSRRGSGRPATRSASPTPSWSVSPVR